MKQVVIYSWPYSQKCMECVHGEGVMSTSGEVFQNSDVVCLENCSDNDGENCSCFREDEDREDADGKEEKEN